MNEVRIDLQPAINKAVAQAKTDLEASVARIGQRLASDFMQDGSRYQQKEGIAHEILRKKIEDYILSDEFSNKLDRIIMTMPDEVFENAARVLLASKTRKVLFAAAADTDQQNKI